MVKHSDSQVSFGSEVSLHDEMLVINPRKTIAGILDSRSVSILFYIYFLEFYFWIIVLKIKLNFEIGWKLCGCCQDRFY